MCVNQQCMAVADLKVAMCNCNGNGVCNNNGHCHCDVGFAPPDCLYPGFGGSQDSGPASSPDGRSSSLCSFPSILFFLSPLSVPLPPSFSSPSLYIVPLLLFFTYHLLPLFLPLQSLYPSSFIIFSLILHRPSTSFFPSSHASLLSSFSHALGWHLWNLGSSSPSCLSRRPFLIPIP